MVNPYVVLGVNPSASVEDIKQAWRRLCRIHHPDRKGGSEAAMMEVNKAYNALMDEEWRARYDLCGDGASLPSVESEARSVIMQFIMAVLTQDWEIPLYQGVVDLIGQNLQQQREQLSKQERKLVKMYRQRGSIEMTAQGKETLGGLFEQFIDGIEQAKQSAARNVEILTRSQAMFKELCKEAKAKGQDPAGFITGFQQTK